MAGRSASAGAARSTGAFGLALFAAATAALWIVSQGKWSDALIDSGREWIVPDALSRGALLYRDIVYWFGPFTPYFQAGFFRLFGSGFPSLVAAGVATSFFVLAVLYAALCRVTGRREAVLWTALAVPALLFMPNAGGSLLGMGYRIWQAAAFALAAALVASHRRLSRRVLGAGLAGALAGLSGLCRTEWGLAALAAVLLALGRGRAAPSGLVRRAGAVALGYVLVFGGGLAVFVLAAGPKAVLDDGHVLFGRLPEETRAFLVAFSGIRDWKRGLVQLVYSAAMWSGALFLLETLAPGRRTRRSIGILAGILTVLAATALFGGASGAVIWSAAPAISAAGLAAAFRRRRGPRGAALAAFGLLGLILSYRRPFHIGDSAYTGPPLLFAFVSAAGLLWMRTARIRPALARRRVRQAFAAAVLLAAGVAFAARLRHYAQWEGEPIPGTGGMLTARPEIAREITGAARAVRQRTGAADGLVVFPEGELINFLSDRRNPIRHQLYLPGYLNDANEGEVLQELERARPAAVVIWLRPTSEYDRGLFGVDYGRRIRAWIGREYDVEAYRAPGAPARTNPRFLLALRRSGG